MKKSAILVLALVLCLTLLPISGLGEEPAYQPGLSREKTTLEYDTIQGLAKAYGLNLEESGWSEPALPRWYTPTSGKPLNAYLVTSLDCEVGINNDGMYSVQEKGLVSSITKYLDQWAKDIENASQGAIRFVNDPGQASILISARQLYKYYGSYSGGGVTVKGYSSEVTFFAYDLTNYQQYYSVKRTRSPGQSTTLSGRPSKFWKNPPDFENTKELEDFVNTILGWYGGNSQIDEHSEGIFKAREALIERGYLNDVHANFFDEAMENAVKLLQKDYGLEETGVIDPVTLVALYYDQAAVDDQLAKYPPEAAE